MIKSKEELAKHIFEQYLLFGTYGIIDKSMTEAFKLGAETMNDYYAIARWLIELWNEGIHHLERHEIAFVGRALNNCICTKYLYSMNEDEYELFCNNVEEMITLVTGNAPTHIKPSEGYDLLCDLTEC